MRDDEQQHPDTLESPGRRLAQARQAKGISEAKVADHLHLSVAMIHALENDQYDQLPSPVFVRGYIRNYARFLGIDDDAMLSLHEANSPQELIAPPPVRGGVQAEIRSSHVVVRLVTWIIVLGLLTLLGLWWQGHLGWEELAVDKEKVHTLTSEVEDNIVPISPQATEPESISDSAPSLAPPPSTPIMQKVPSAAEETGKESSAPSAALDEALRNTTPTLPVDAPPAVVGPAAEEAAPKHQVVLDFIGACWVDVRDANRTFKLYGEMRKGEQRVLEGTPPYSIILGNSPMVRITVDGKPFPIEQYARGSVARFHLDPTTLEQ